MKPTKKYMKAFMLLIVLSIILISSTSIYQYMKQLPKDISYKSEQYVTSNVEFLYDLTYEKNEQINHEQIIFDSIHTLIEEAEDFILIDMFLFNNEYERTSSYPAISEELVTALINKKKENKDLPIVVITDRINTFYDSYPASIEKTLTDHGIELIYTDMKKLKDSNPIYSSIHRVFFQWFGTSGNGWLPNAFSPDSPKVTVRSYLDLLNFKANHRKLIVTEQKAIITSANPHDSSGYHSNIGFVVEGDILQDFIKAERAVSKISGGDTSIFDSFQPNAAKVDKNAIEYNVQLLTEGKIKESLIDELQKTVKNDQITIGVFYLSDRDVIKELLNASERGVKIKLILDANKDAFGREKNGIPNRPVAYELKKKSNDNIQIRWYHTTGEQYHTKLIFIERENENVLIGGSANLTKRNIGDLNIEANVKISSEPNTKLMVEVDDYFERLWTNDGAIYTDEYEQYEVPSFINRFIYRFQEWSGLSTF